MILGTLFKLTHLPGANFFLFLGMGTEVFVFFISAFDRPFDKTTDGMELDAHVKTSDDLTEETDVEPVAVSVGGVPGGVVIGGGGAIAEDGVISGGASGGGTTVIGGGGGTIIIGGSGGSSQEAVDTEAIAAVASSVAAVSRGAGESGDTGVSGPAIAGLPTVNPELEEATANYVDELKRLTEMLSKVSEQSERLARDSEEMENLNRTLTGICKVYEMQLKGASQQIGTIDEINEQSRKMAQQIAELNKIYTRMIEAMTVNMPQGGMSSLNTQNSQSTQNPQI